MATQEQIKEAHKKLDAAIENFIQECEWGKAGVLTSWVIVGHQVAYDNDGDLVDTYPIWYRGAQQSHHVNLGLLNAGIDAVSSNFTRVDDEDG